MCWLVGECPGFNSDFASDIDLLGTNECQSLRTELALA
jgi:hypothetical protein